MLLIVAEGSLVGGYEGVNETIRSREEGEGPQEESRKLVEEGRELVPVENLALDSTTGETNEGPDPSAQEEPSTPTWDETPHSSKEPQVNTNLAPSPHFDAEPLTMVFLEMKSLYEEENENSEEDYDNVYVASFIAARKKQRIEEEKKKRRSVKGGKQVNEEEVPPALVVDIDEEENEEPDSLIRKSSKKPAIPRSRRKSSMKNVEVEESGEKVSEKSGKKLSEKSAKKEKSVRKSVKKKAGDNEEPGSSKKAKVGVAKDE
ncbi:protein PXR1-like [Nicotiana sylvestris]|uniref:protein PXR1-like n=1 Tax=Nicotiana sylvestris TaxID=4096 RepID=UPI00388C738A